MHHGRGTRVRMRNLLTLVLRVPVAHGPLPLLLGVGAFASLGAFVGRRRRRLPLGAVVGWFAVALAAIVAVGTAIGIEHRVGSSFPRSFFVWAALPVFALGLTVDARRRGQRRALGWGLAGAVLFAVFGAAEVNAHYAYVPTVGDLVGAPMRDQVPMLEAREARAVVARVGAVAAGSRAPLPFDGSDVRLRPDRGVLMELRMPGTVSGFAARPGYVWVPPSYLRDPGTRLPVVMMLAGVPGDPSNMARAAGALSIADSYAAAHGGVAPILVFPDHNGGFFRDTECVDGPRGNAETYLTVDVPRVVAAAVPGAASAPWAIVGYSEGGTCAVTLSLRHPGLFRAFVDIAGDPAPNAARGPHADALTIARLYGHDRAAWRRHDPARLLRERPPRDLAAWFVAGRGDRAPLGAARALGAEAAGAGLYTHLIEMPGGHNFDTVHRALALTFPGVADRLLASPPAAAAS